MGDDANLQLIQNSLNSQSTWNGGLLHKVVIHWKAWETASDQRRRTLRRMRRHSLRVSLVLIRERYAQSNRIGDAMEFTVKHQKHKRFLAIDPTVIDSIDVQSLRKELYHHPMYIRGGSMETTWFCTYFIQINDLWVISAEYGQNVFFPYNIPNENQIHGTSGWIRLCSILNAICCKVKRIEMASINITFDNSHKSFEDEPDNMRVVTSLFELIW